MSDYLVKISPKALALQANEDDHAFVALNFPYTGIYWRGCTNVLFEMDEPLDEEVKLMFSLN